MEMPHENPNLWARFEGFPGGGVSITSLFPGLMETQLLSTADLAVKLQGSAAAAAGKSP